MTQALTDYEYAYQDSNLTNAHSFLMNPLLSILPKTTNSQGKKLRVLDLGCGNGSLSNAIAQQSYEVIGGHIKFFSVKTLTNLLETEGYTDIKFSFAGRLPYLWKSMLSSCIKSDL